MSTPIKTEQLLTAEQFFEWSGRPENRDRHFELERGRVVEVSRPGELHGVVCGNVVWVLNSFVRQRRRGYVCGNDTGIIWDRDPDIVRGPDVVFYDAARRFEDFNPKYSEEVPHLAVEVLSPTDRITSATRRITQFLKWGSLVWLVDPEERTVTVFRPDRSPEVIEADQELTGDGILASFRCAVAELFFVASEEAPPKAP